MEKQEKVPKEVSGEPTGWEVARGVFGGLAKMAFLPGGMGSHLSLCYEGDVEQLRKLNEKRKENWSEVEEFRYSKIRFSNSFISKNICYACSGLLDTGKLIGYVYLAKSIYNAFVC